MAEVLAAPTAIPPFQSNTMDQDFSMNEDFEISDAPSPEYFVPDMDVEGQAPPPGPPSGPAGPAGPHFVWSSRSNQTTPISSVPFTPMSVPHALPDIIDPPVIVNSPFTRSRSPFVDLRHTTAPTINVDPLMPDSIPEDEPSAPSEVRPRNLDFH